MSSTFVSKKDINKMKSTVVQLEKQIDKLDNLSEAHPTLFDDSIYHLEESIKHLEIAITKSISNNYRR